MRTLSHQEARQVYDRVGARQDSQGYYEDPATRRLVAKAGFDSAESVFELGCGTGRFAAGLFEGPLSETARYRGIDLSPEMVRLARERLAAYADRAEVVLTDGGPPTAEPAECHDRFVSNYVLDLLSEEDIRANLEQAHRMLRPGGLLCLSGLTRGSTPVSRLVTVVVGWVHRVRPALVGGCRPVDLVPFLSDQEWQIEHHSKVVAYGIPSEVVVARKLPG